MDPPAGTPAAALVDDLPGLVIKLTSSLREDRAAALNSLASWEPRPGEAPQCRALAAAAFAMFTAEPELRIDVDASLSRLFGPRVDCYAVLLRVFPILEQELVACDAFWGVIHYGIRVSEADRHLRKTAVSLLLQGLDVLRAQEVQPCALAVEQWGAFCTLLDALDDMPLHLLLDVWPRVAVLIGSEGTTNTAAALAGPAVLPRPSFRAPVPFAWSCVILDRAFGHEMLPVRRTLAMALLSAKLGGQDDIAGGAVLRASWPAAADAAVSALAIGSQPRGLSLPPWFICGTMEPCRADTGAVFCRGAAGVGDGPATDALSLALPSMLTRCSDPALYRGVASAFGPTFGAFLTAFLGAAFLGAAFFVFAIMLEFNE